MLVKPLFPHYALSEGFFFSTNTKVVIAAAITTAQITTTIITNVLSFLLSFSLGFAAEAVVAEQPAQEAEAPAPRAERRPAPRANNRRRRKVCLFCEDKIDHIDYKDTARLRKFVSERGKILPRRITGTCAKHQRALTTEIKRARQMALLFYTSAHSSDVKKKTNI